MSKRRARSIQGQLEEKFSRTQNQRKSRPPTAAYCAKDWTEATSHAADCLPATSPPYDQETIEPLLAEYSQQKNQIFYLNLHGFQGEPNYFGQEGGTIGPTALTPEVVRLFDWSGKVIFAEVCYSAKDDGGPIARAFLEAGAEAFIGSVGPAYGRARPTLLDGEADRLLQLFRFTYAHIKTPAVALQKAKELLKIASWPLDDDDRATIRDFVCLTRRTNQ